MTTDLPEVHARALAETRRFVAGVAPEQWAGRHPLRGLGPARPGQPRGGRQLLGRPARRGPDDRRGRRPLRRGRARRRPVGRLRPLRRGGPGRGVGAGRDERAVRRVLRPGAGRGVPRPPHPRCRDPRVGHRHGLGAGRHPRSRPGRAVLGHRGTPARPCWRPAACSVTGSRSTRARRRRRACSLRSVVGSDAARGTSRLTHPGSRPAPENRRDRSDRRARAAPAHRTARLAGRGSPGRRGGRRHGARRGRARHRARRFEPVAGRPRRQRLHPTRPAGTSPAPPSACSRPADKPALIIGIVVMSLLIGAALGAASRRRPWVGVGRVRRLRGGRRASPPPAIRWPRWAGPPSGPPSAWPPGRSRSRCCCAWPRSTHAPARPAGAVRVAGTACATRPTSPHASRRAFFGWTAAAGAFAATAALAGRAAMKGTRQRRPRRHPAAGADQPGRARRAHRPRSRARASPRSRSTGSPRTSCPTTTSTGSTPRSSCPR